MGFNLDDYEIIKTGRFCWKLSITDRRWGSPPFFTKHYRTKRSAERTMRWHQTYKTMIGKKI